MARIIDNPNEIKKDDKVIAVMGMTGCGISSFIDALTESTKWAGTTLKSVTQDVRAIRLQLFNEDVVLVDTPGFDNTVLTDVAVLELIGEWLQNIYDKDIKLAGILYLHRISDNRMPGSALRILRMMRKLCGELDLTDKVILVTTMWHSVSSGKGEQREEELRSYFWRPMLELGARTARFCHRHDAQDVVRMVLDSRTWTRQLQEETVERKRHIIEEPAKMLYNQLQTLLSQHIETLGEMQEAARRTNNYQMLADLEKQRQRMQAELEKTLKTARKLNIPLSRRIILFISPKARAFDLSSGRLEQVNDSSYSTRLLHISSLILCLISMWKKFRIWSLSLSPNSGNKKQADKPRKLQVRFTSKPKHKDGYDLLVSS